MERAAFERRAFCPETRADGRMLVGYAARFNIEARLGDITETVAPGAFTETLSKEGDVLALVDHDPARLLARTRSGTLRLSQDRVGLAFELDTPDTQLGRDVLALANRGDLGGMSFGFVATDEFRDADRRELRAVELIEISVVAAFPAYDGTSIEPRGSLPNRAYASRAIRIWETMPWA